VVGGDEGEIWRSGEVAFEAVRAEERSNVGRESSECVRVMRVKTRLGAIFG
jgi:hypothetical protein